MIETPFIPEQANAAFSTTLPLGADVITWFCLAKDTLRKSETCELEHDYRSLERDDFKEAARVFGWHSSRYQDQAVAYMSTKMWAAALESSNKKIDAKKPKYFRERRSKKLTLWRTGAATVTAQRPDNILVELWAIKALVLDQLGRKDEAALICRRPKETAISAPSNAFEAVPR